MRGLFRFAVGVLALGMGMIGCNSSRSPGPDDSSGQESSEVPNQAVFRVPGMS
jgi:hypothetical protein